MKTFSPAPKPSPRQPKPKARPRSVNPKRKAREFRRCYHSEARCEFVRARRCCVCKRVGHSENAHVGKGASSKGPYTEIAPLCGPWGIGIMGEGCHRRLHRIGVESFRLYSGVDLDAAAARTEAAWQASQGIVSPIEQYALSVSVKA